MLKELRRQELGPIAQARRVDPDPEVRLVQFVADALALIQGEALEGCPRSVVIERTASCVGKDYGVCPDPREMMVGGMCRLQNLKDLHIPFFMCNHCGSALESRGVAVRLFFAE